MSLSEKAKIYKNVWQCAYQRRYMAKVSNQWNLYQREHETVLMCLHMKNAKWWYFDNDKKN